MTKLVDKVEGWLSQNPTRNTSDPQKEADRLEVYDLHRRYTELEGAAVRHEEIIESKESRIHRTMNSPVVVEETQKDSNTVSRALVTGERAQVSSNESPSSFSSSPPPSDLGHRVANPNLTDYLLATSSSPEASLPRIMNPACSHNAGDLQYEGNLSSSRTLLKQALLNVAEGSSLKGDLPPPQDFFSSYCKPSSPLNWSPSWAIEESDSQPSLHESGAPDHSIRSTLSMSCIDTMSCSSKVGIRHVTQLA